MNIEEKLEIHDCPLCDGGALLEEEGGCGYYVMCLECGCQSVTIDFHSEEERLEAAKKTVFPEGKLYLYLWQFQFLSIPKLKYLIFPSIWC